MACEKVFTQSEVCDAYIIIRHHNGENVARSFSYDDINHVLRCSGKLQAERGKLLAPNKLPDMNDKN